MMAAERSEVAHNFSFSGKAKFAFQKNHFTQQRGYQHPRASHTPRTFHLREYGNPNVVPMELGYVNQ